jgi:hypothetical protein
MRTSINIWRFYAETDTVYYLHYINYYFLKLLAEISGTLDVCSYKLNNQLRHICYSEKFKRSCTHFMSISSHLPNSIIPNLYRMHTKIQLCISCKSLSSASVLWIGLMISPQTEFPLLFGLMKWEPWTWWEFDHFPLFSVHGISSFSL